MVCSIGFHLKRKCSSEKQYRFDKHFSLREWSLIKLRSGALSLKTVCLSHANQFGRFYVAKQKQCCNPLNVHASVRRNNLKSITPQYHDKFHQYVENVIEGRKICIQCDEAVRAREASIHLRCDSRDEKMHSGRDGKIKKL